MKFELTYYKDGQIQKAINIIGFDKAVKFAARELGKEMESLTAECTDVKLETTFLTHCEWASTIWVEGDEIFGITVNTAN